MYLLIPGGYYEGISREHDGLGFAPSITPEDHGSSAIAGIAHYSAAHFPREFQGNLFNGNPVTRRINRARLDWRGSSPAAGRQPDFVTSEDPSFRPVQVKLGPDGALWIADFYNTIIGHYEVPLTHPARDRAHGRIWRVVWRGLDRPAPVLALPDFSRDTAAALVPRLSDRNLVVRSLAVSELLGREDARGAAAALQAAAARLIDGTDSTADGTAALPLLMSLDRLGRGDDALLRRALSRPESDVAIAALRVLIYALRLALKKHALTADAAVLRHWAAADWRRGKPPAGCGARRGAFRRPLRGVSPFSRYRRQPRSEPRRGRIAQPGPAGRRHSRPGPQRGPRVSAAHRHAAERRDKIRVESP